MPELVYRLFENLVSSLNFHNNNSIVVNDNDGGEYSTSDNLASQLLLPFHQLSNLLTYICHLEKNNTKCEFETF